MKLSKLILFLMFLFNCTSIFSQDQIFLKSGEKIFGRVIEERAYHIKFTKEKSLDAKTYLIRKVDVLNIKYGEKREDLSTNSLLKDGLLKIEKKGVRYKFFKEKKKIDKKEFMDLIEKNPMAFNQYKSGRTLRIIGSVVGVSSSVALVYSVVQQGSVEYPFIFRPNYGPIILSLMSFATSFVISDLGDSWIYNSADTYNFIHTLEEKLILNENGIGWRIPF